MRGLGSKKKIAKIRKLHAIAIGTRYELYKQWCINEMGSVLGIDVYLKDEKIKADF